MNTIEKATILDSDLILEIARNTFSETFLEHNTPENLASYLTEHINITSIKWQLKNPCSIFYLSKINNKVVGYLKLNLSKAQTELQDDLAIEIERIYVLKAFQNQKIGQKFIDKTILVANEMKLKYVFLGVWEHNQQAIKFYKKNNFGIFDTHFFSIGNDVQTDFLMRKIL